MSIETTESLCKKYTMLNSEEIAIITEAAKILQPISALMQADIFIDCKTNDPDKAIVIAESFTNSKAYLYKKNSVMGEFAERQNEPAVLRTLDLGIPTSDMWAVTQENKTVSQKVSPIFNNDGDVIGALIAEKKDVTEDERKKKSNFSDLAKTTETILDELLLKKNGSQSIHCHLQEGIVLFDMNGVCKYANPSAQDLYAKLGFLDKLKDATFFSALHWITRHCPNS